MPATEPYSHLLNEGSGVEEQAWQEKQKKPFTKSFNWIQIACYFASAFILLLIGFICGTAVTNKHNTPTPSISNTGNSRDYTDCGGTPAIALERNCRFDPVSFTWELPDCHDEFLIEEFLTLDDWKWYSELNNTDSTVPYNVVMRGDQDLFVDWNFHTHHCVYMWKKMHKAVIEQKSIDEHLGSWNHTLHCGQVFLYEGFEKTDVVTGANIRYPSCNPVVQASQN